MSETLLAQAKQVLSREKPLDNTSQLVEEIVQETRSFWHRGVRKGLTLFKDVERPARLSNDEDTLVVPTSREVGSYHKNSCLSYLIKWCPIYFELELDELGIVLAGGSLSTCLMGNEYTFPHDYDLFLVGLSEEEAKKNIQILANRLSKKVKKMEVYRTSHCLTFFCRKPDLVFQVILRRYDTLAEVLHGFDLGPCQLAVVQGSLFTTPMGQFCYDHQCIVPLLEKRRPSFEHRLEKYFQRGFDMVLPHLPAAYHPIPASKEGGERPENNPDFPYFSISLRPHRSDFRNKAVWKGETRAQSDYSFELPYGQTREIARLNLRLLSRDEVPVDGLVGSAVYREDLDLFTIPVTISPSFFIEESHPSIMEMALPRAIKVFGAEEVRPLASHVMEWMLSKSEEEKAKYLKGIEELAEKKAASVNALAKEHPIPSQFILVEDDTLTAPFSLKILTFPEWYGLEEIEKKREAKKEKKAVKVGKEGKMGTAKRPPSKYNQFMCEKLEQLKKEQPTKTHSELFALAVEAWHTAPENPGKQGEKSDALPFSPPTSG